VGGTYAFVEMIFIVQYIWQLVYICFIDNTSSAARLIIFVLLIILLLLLLIITTMAHVIV
jgi:hypothetical protein